MASEAVFPGYKTLIGLLPWGVVSFACTLYSFADLIRLMPPLTAASYVCALV